MKITRLDNHTGQIDKVVENVKEIVLRDGYLLYAVKNDAGFKTLAILPKDFVIKVED